MKTTSTTPSTGLFDEEHSWRTDPRVAFESLMNSGAFAALGRRELAGRAAVAEGRPLRQASANVYKSMFLKLVDDLAEHQICLLDATTEQLTRWIASRELTAGSRLRYVRMLERIFEHLRGRGIVPANPMTSVAWRLVNERDRVREELPTVHVGGQAVSDAVLKMIDELAATGHWRDMRDAAMVALMLGAGLKLYELSSMRVSWISGQANAPIIEVPPVGASRAHRAPLEPFAVHHLSNWLQVRQQMQFVQPMLFFGSAGDGRRTTGCEPLNKSTVYRRIRAILQAAGVDVPRMGGRTLRNSYAVNALSNGESPELVEERLGLRESRSMGRYKEAAARMGRA